MGDGVVAGSGEDVDLGVGEAKGGEDGAAWALVGDLDFDFDFATAAGHLDSASIGRPQSLGIFGMDFEGFFGEKVVDP